MNEILLKLFDVQNASNAGKSITCTIKDWKDCIQKEDKET